MKGRKYLILIAVICAAAIVSLCGCRAYSLENSAEEFESVPPALTETEEEPKAPPPASPVIDGGDNGGDISYADVSNTATEVAVTEVAAQLAYTPIDGEHCEVYCTNKDEATYASISTQAVIDGKSYFIHKIADRGFENCKRLKTIDVGLNVRIIGDYAFFSCGELTSVTYPENYGAISEVGYDAFAHNYKLKDFNFSNVRKIADVAFINCTSLTSVNAPYATEIGMQAFLGCKNLEEVKIPHAETVKDNAFTDCPKLKEIVLYPSVTSMGSGVFLRNNTRIKLIKGVNTENWDGDWNNGNENSAIVYNYEVPAEFRFSALNETECEVCCTNQKEATYAEIPAVAVIDEKEYTVTKVAEYGFNSNNYLMHVSLPDSVKRIGFYAFRDCTVLTDINLFSVTEIENLAFNKTGLSSADMPSVEKLGTAAFYGCANLESVNIPEVIYIGAYAFRNCPKLSQIVIPETVETMHAVIFYGNNTQVYAEADSKPEGWADDWNLRNENQNVIWGWSEGKAILGYNAISETECEVYCTNKDEATYADIPAVAVIDGKEYYVTKVAEYGFYDSNYLMHVSLPDSVKIIGSYAFQNCTVLTDINLFSVTEIGSCAFNKTGLSSADMPSVEGLDVWAFKECANLESVNIPEVIYIRTSAFGNCPKLSQIVIPATVEIMQTNIFYGNNTQVYAEADSKPEMWADDWNYGNANQNVIWGWGAGSVKYYFTKISETECSVRCANKSTVVEAYIPSTAIIDGKEYTVTEIAANGFYGCRKLKKVVLSHTVKKINNLAFGNCSELNSVSLVNVEEMGNNVFYGCPELKELVIPKSVVNVGAYILKNNNTKVYVRGSSDEGWNEAWNAYNSGEVEFNSPYYKPMEIK